MKILLLNSFKHWGGGEWWTVELGKGMQARGHEVTVACPPATETARRAGESRLKVLPVHLESDVAFWRLPGLIRYLKKNEIDLLFCNQTRDVKLGGLAGRLAGTPRIFARLGLDVIKNKPDHRIAYTRFIDGIIANTHALKQKYDAFNWFDQHRIRVVHDGIEIPKQVPGIDLHERFDLRNGTKTVVAAGRLSPQKGFDLLVEVARMAMDSDKPWTILIAGSGRSEESLKRMSASMHVQDHIRFLGFQEDVLPIMKSADVFVLSSRSESMSNVLREAMAVRTACVATDVTGVDELIEQEVSGMIVEAVTPEAIYDGIDRVLSDDAFRLKLAHNGFERVSGHFTLQHMVQQAEKIFEDSLRDRKSHAG